MKPIHDKAAVALNFPDKVYMGTFGRDSKFEATVEDDGLRLKLVRPGEEKRVFEMHIHHYLLADIIAECRRRTGHVQGASRRSPRGPEIGRESGPPPLGGYQTW
jgi:hypothetical protein